MGYQPKVYKEQGGNVLVIRGHDSGVLKGQTSAAATPAQAAHVADFATSAALTTGQAAKLNSVLKALRGVGVLATS